jgi:hypothetical protein
MHAIPPIQGIRALVPFAVGRRPVLKFFAMDGPSAANPSLFWNPVQPKAELDSFSALI